MKKNNDLVSHKSNVLIQNYAWMLKKYELKIFEFLCCCYNTEYYNSEKNEIRCSLNIFEKECKITPTDTGFYYSEFKKAIKKLSDKSIWVINEDKEELLRIINKVIIKKNEGIVICQMSEDFRLHMEKHPLGNAFVELKIINQMTSKYSINLYNLIRSWDGSKKVNFDISYLREKLCCKSSTYDNISLFKNLLNKAVEEINEYSSLNIEYITEKTGKKITSITFIINKKCVNKNQLIEKINKQISFEDLVNNYFTDSIMIELIRNIILDVFIDTNDTIQISNMEYDNESVKKVFEMVNYDIVEDILRSINNNEFSSEYGNYIKYPKGYLKASLYYKTLAKLSYDNYLHYSKCEFSDIVYNNTCNV